MSYNRDGLTTLRHYQEAVAKEFSTKPVARDPNMPKPLGYRLKKGLRIEKQGETIMCIGYGHNMLAYTPDDVITVVPNLESKENHWAQQWVSVFFGPVLGTDVQVRHGDLWIRCSWMHEDVLKGGYIPMRKGQQFKWDGYTLKCLNPTFPSVHALNRKTTKEAMNDYKHFVKYVKGMAKMRGIGTYVSKEEIEEMEHYDGVIERTKSGHPDDLLRGFYYLVAGSVRYNFFSEAFAISSVAKLIHTLQDKVYKIRQSEKGDLLIKGVCYDGKIVKDTNAKYL